MLTPLLFYGTLGPASLDVENIGNVTVVGIEAFNLISACVVMSLMLWGLIVAHILIPYPLIHMEMTLTFEYDPLNISRQ